MRTRDKALAQFFGGPHDGATRRVTGAEIAAGFVDERDAFGQNVRYTVVKLDAPHQVDDLVVDYRLQPKEGLW